MSTDHYKKEVGMMNLDKLIAARESISTAAFPIPEKELLARYEQLYTGAISDVLREYCLLQQALPSYLRPLREDLTVAGIAFTVKCAPSSLVRGEMDFRTKMLEAMHEDAFVVYDTSRDEEATMWGGVMTATAVAKKVKASCIDGCIRDTRQILEKDFPVFYKNRSPNGSLGRCLITHFQIPIRIGSVDIKPGDVIMGDIDGVLCVPRDIAYDVLMRAEEIRANENKIFGWLAEGKTAREITDEGGYF